jgi:hypothetical protein
MFKNMKAKLESSKHSLVNHLGAFLIWLISVFVSVVVISSSLGFASIPAVILMRHTTILYLNQIGVDEEVIINTKNHFNNMLMLASVLSFVMSVLFGLYGITLLSLCTFAISYQESFILNDLNKCEEGTVA